MAENEINIRIRAQNYARDAIRQVARDTRELGSVFSRIRGEAATRGGMLGPEMVKELRQARSELSLQRYVTTGWTQAWKASHESLFITTRALRDVASIGRSWASILNTLNISMMVVTEAEEAYAQAVARSGRNSEEAKRASERLADARRRQGEAAFATGIEALSLPGQALTVAGDIALMKMAFGRGLGRLASRGGLTSMLGLGRAGLYGLAALGGLASGGFLGKASFMMGAQMRGMSYEQAEVAYERWKQQNPAAYNLITLGGTVPQHTPPRPSIGNVTINIQEARSPEEVSRRIIDELNRFVGP